MNSFNAVPNDNWCSPFYAQNGKRVTGGAARNCRIKAAGGMLRIREKIEANVKQPSDLFCPVLRVVVTQYGEPVLPQGYYRPSSFNENAPFHKIQ